MSEKFVQVYFTQLENGAEIALTAVPNNSAKQEMVVAWLREKVVPAGRPLYSRLVYFFPTVLDPIDLCLENVTTMNPVIW